MELRYGFLASGASSTTMVLPAEGVMWFTMILDTDVEDLYIELDADIADLPWTT